MNSSEIALLDTNLTLWATTDDEDIASDRQTIKFLPGIYVEPELILQGSSNTGELLIKGLPEVLKQLSATPADSTIIYVSSLKSEDPNIKKYQVQLIDYHWRLADMEDAMGIQISSPLTKQNLKVIVKVGDDFKGSQQCGLYRSPILNFLQNYKYAMLMAIAMIGIFLITFYCEYTHVY